MASISNIFCKRAEENYLNTYKALHLGGADTLMSKIIRSSALMCPTHTESETEQRLVSYRFISQYLKNLSSFELSNILKTANYVTRGKGGEIFRTELKGMNVIIKKIPCTEIERKNPKSTKNLFNLPLYYHYGVDSTGFGTREVSAHKLTTKWVLKGECQNFPLMYHNTVIGRTSPNRTSSEKEIEERTEYVKYWNSNHAVALRMNAIELREEWAKI